MSAPLVPPRSFVGRQQVLAALQAARQRVLAGQGQLVLLVGEAGIGKTRTAEQLATLAAGEGFRVLWGRCHDEAGAPPFWPWIQILRAFAEEQRAGERSAGEEEAQASSALAGRLGGWIDAPEPAAAIRPEAARFRLFDAVTTWLRRAAHHQPLLLVFDDLHVADRSSLRLLAFLARELAATRILIVGACRSSAPAQGQALFAALGQSALQTIPLAGLDERGVRQLMTDAGDEPPSRALLRSVMNLTEGNPFFVTEIARWLAHDEMAGESQASRLPIPDSVNAVIARHLDAVSGPTRELLRIAAVLGRDIDVRLLRRVWEEERTGQHLAALDEATRVHLLHERDDRTPFRFRHELIRQALYEEVAPGARSRLHAQVAGILEARYGAEVERHASELAYHFARAQHLPGAEKAVSYARAAGEQCLAAHAYDEAAAHFARALAGKVSPPAGTERAGLLDGLGRAKAATSLRWNRQEAWECLRLASEHYLAAGDTDRAVAAVTQAAITPEAVTGVVAAIERVLAVVNPDSRAAGWLLARLAAARYFESGDYAAASRDFARALVIARRAGDEALTLRALALQTAVDHFDLRWEGVLEKSQRVIQLAGKIDDPYAATYARYRLAYALTFAGRAAEAEQEAGTNLAEAEKLADEGLLEDALYVNVALAQLRGDWEDARAFSDRGLDLAPHHLALLHLRVLLEYELGETTRGRDDLARLMQASSHAGPYPLREAYRAVVLPQVAMLGEEPIPAEPVPLPSNPNATVIVTVGRALAAVRDGDVPAAQRALRFLATKQGAILVSTVVTDRLRGLLWHTAGKLDQAAAHFEAALTFCRAAGYRPELAWICHDFARCLVARDQTGDRAKAAALLSEAAEIAADLGMRPLQDRAAACRQRHQAMLERQPGTLSPREVRVVQLLAAGKTNQEIAHELFISAHTVAAHVAHILAKTGCRNRTEAATYAMRELLPQPAGQK